MDLLFEIWVPLQPWECARPRPARLRPVETACDALHGFWDAHLHSFYIPGT